jgi:hypothetical protein
MSTKAGIIEVPGRPVGFRLWAAAVSVLAGAALIMSAVALTRAGRSSDREAASVGAPLWDAGKLEAMEGRVLAGSVGSHGYALWDAGKLEAMAGRVLAETVGAEGSATLLDAGKLEAMAGRVLAE